MIDKRPALITRDGDARDVANGLGLARARRLPLPVRGSGHDCAPLRSVDYGVVVDPLLLREITAPPPLLRVVPSGGEIGDHAG